eukprot:TRINITY_DN636_c0_g1_i1.p1 TRINITY_DN636_c0_g1~~TRINITY_DN636_c0_g1_i1.p1  ORF type:complete len:375 (-),score=77.75 TRINITY_DN636_c0_g1_i1:71-1195(-)
MKVLFILCIFALFAIIKTQNVVSQCNGNFIPNFGGELCQNSSFPSCEHGYACLNNSVVTTGSPYCQIITNLQTSCNFTSQCTSIGMDCILNVCSPKRWAGETCTINEDCLTLNCNSNFICEGLPLGSPCVASYDNKCGKDLFCAYNGTFFPNSTAAGTCQPAIAIGQPCVNSIGFGFISPRPITDIASACANGSLCDIATGVCTVPGTVPVGSNATNPSSCAFGAYSHLPGTGCINYCGTGINDPKCLTGYYCNCNGNTNTSGTCSEDPCGTQKTAVYNCMNTKGCRDIWTGPQFQSLIYRSLVNGTCVYNNCQQIVWDYECCLTNFGTRGDLTPGVSCTNPPSPVPAPSISSTLSSCFLLLISIIFFIFVVYL